MIVGLNGFILNSPTDASVRVYLDEPIDGLAIPAIRTSSGDFSGRDGGYVGAQFYGRRFISLTGRIFAQSALLLEQSRRDLQAVLTSPPLAMTITTNAGSQYLLTCYLDSFDMPITRAMTSARFSITLIAPDPVIYDNAAGGSLTATVNLALGGGFAWPITWPIVWAAGAPPTVVTNTGEVVLYPKITLTGKMTNPKIMNNTTGEFFTFTGFTTTTDDVVVIDMKNRTVLLNGGSILPFASSTSRWWALLPGNNDITLTSSDSSDTVVATIEWRSGYRGI